MSPFFFYFYSLHLSPILSFPIILLFFALCALAFFICVLLLLLLEREREKKPCKMDGSIGVDIINYPRPLILIPIFNLFSSSALLLIKVSTLEVKSQVEEEDELGKSDLYLVFFAVIKYTSALKWVKLYKHRGKCGSFSFQTIEISAEERCDHARWYYRSRAHPRRKNALNSFNCFACLCVCNLYEIIATSSNTLGTAPLNRLFSISIK